MKPTTHPDPERCRLVTDIIALVGDKWSVQVVMCLGDGQRRFTEIRRAVEGISQKMLTVTLRGLERDGYVRRTVHATIPPRVDYELTPLGYELLVPLKALGDWALTRYRQVAAARAAYDARALADAAE